MSDVIIYQGAAIPFSFSRQNGQPLDVTSVMCTLADITIYAANTEKKYVPYEGQTIACLEDKMLYILELKNGVLVPKLSGGVKLIKRDDNVELTDDAALSALRSVKEIEERAISRTKRDTAAEVIEFAKGLTAGSGKTTVSGDGKITTLNLLVQLLAETYDLNVSHVATMMRTIIKDYVSSEAFTPGLTGEGFKISKSINGDWNLEIDNVVVRKVMTIFEMIISKVRSVNGGLVISSANGRIKSVAETTGTPAYYVIGIEGDMQFVVDDYVRCQVFNGGQAKYYWVRVSSISGNSILVLKSEFTNGSVPAIGDDLVQMGNATNTARQGIIYLTASEDGKPRISVMDGVNSTSLVCKNKVILGCLDGITDTDFPADFQPSGYGLYAMNVFLKGIFILRNGKSVEGEFDSVRNALITLSQEFSVAMGEFTSKITEVIEYADGKVDALQIGGRNLALNSEFTRTGTYNLETYRLSEELIAGEMYCATFFGTLGANKSFFQLWMGGGYTVIGNYTMISNGIYMLQFTAPVLVGGNGRRNEVTVYAAPPAITTTSTVTKFKLERGNKPTDWTPAPEDVAADTEAARLAAVAAQTKANEAATDAATAQTAANNAASTANAAKSRLDNWSADGSISPTEKLTLKQEQKALLDEKTQIVADAVKYAVSSTAYVTAYTNYNGELTYHTATTPEVIAIRANFATYQATYYTAKQTILNAISVASKKYAEDKANDAKQAAISDAASKYPTKSQVTSEIKQKADEINLSVTEKIEGVQVGGRNYYRKDTIMNSQGTAAIINKADSINGFMLTGAQDVNSSVIRMYNVITSNGYWTISFDVAGTQNTPVSFAMDVCDRNQKEFRTTADNQYTHFEYTVLVDNYTSDTYNFIDFEHIHWAYFNFRNFKVEKGNKPTDWTPAPEDVQSQITENKADIQILSDQIKSTVSKETFNALGDRVGSAESAITQQATQITAQVTKVNDLTGRVDKAELALHPDKIWLGLTAKVDVAIESKVKTGISISGNEVNIFGTTILNGNLIAGIINATNITTGRLTVTDGAVIGGMVIENNVLKGGSIMLTEGAKIGGFTVNGNSLTSSDSTGRVMIGDNLVRFLRINESDSTSMLAVRNDNGSALSLYSHGATGRCLGIQAQNSAIAIESAGSHLFKQRTGEVWNAPGVLWCGQYSCSNWNPVLVRSWGDGLGLDAYGRRIVPTISRSKSGCYTITHNLGHVDYFVHAIGNAQIRDNWNWWNTTVSFFNHSANYFSLQFKDDGGGEKDPAEFQVMIFGRNKF